MGPWDNAPLTGRPKRSSSRLRAKVTANADVGTGGDDHHHQHQIQRVISRRLSPVGLKPPPVFEHSTVFLSDHNTGRAKMAIFGGFDGRGDRGDAVWVYDVQSNQWTVHARDERSQWPVERSHHGAIHRTRDNSMIIVGGVALNGSPSDNEEDENGHAPHAKIRDAKRESHRRRRSLNKKGSGKGADSVSSNNNDNLMIRLDHVYSYSLSDGKWDKIRMANSDSSPTIPGGRSEMVTVYRPDTDEMVVYGGALQRRFTDDHTFTDEMFAFSFGDNTWKRVYGANAKRSTKGKGSSSNVTRSDQTLGPPGGRASAAGVYSMNRKSLIIFGGHNAHSYHADLWEYSFISKRWQRILPTNVSQTECPSAKSLARMFFANDESRLYLHGGWSYDSATERNTFLNELHCFDFPTGRWSPVSVVGDYISPRSGHSLICDQRTNKFIVWGGSKTYSIPHNDIYEVYLPSHLSACNVKPKFTYGSLEIANRRSLEDRFNAMLDAAIKGGEQAIKEGNYDVAQLDQLDQFFEVGEFEFKNKAAGGDMIRSLSFSGSKLELTKAIQQLQQDSVFTSVAVICKDDEIVKFHLPIIMQSSFLMNHMWKNRRRKGIAKTTFNIKIDFLPADMLRSLFIPFLYGSLPSIPSADMLERVFKTAKLWCLPELTWYIRRAAMAIISLDTVFDSLRAAELMSDEQLMRKCMSFIKEHRAKVLAMPQFCNLSEELRIKIVQEVGLADDNGDTDIIIITEESEEADVEVPQDVPNRSLVNFLSALFSLKEGQLCDIILKCDGGEINAHMAVLAARSPALRQQMTSLRLNQKDANGLPSLTIPDVSLHALRCFVQFLYCANVEMTFPESIPAGDLLTQLARLAFDYECMDLFFASIRHLFQYVSANNAFTVLRSLLSLKHHMQSKRQRRREDDQTLQCSAGVKALNALIMSTLSAVGSSVSKSVLLLQLGDLMDTIVSRVENQELRDELISKIVELPHAPTSMVDIVCAQHEPVPSTSTSDIRHKRNSNARHTDTPNKRAKRK